MIGKETFSYGDMKRQTEKTQFIMAMQKEISDQKKSKHWKLVHQSEIEGAKKIIVLWSFRRKRENIIGKFLKYKSRTCAHGGMQEKGINYWETYAPLVQ